MAGVLGPSIGASRATTGRWGALPKGAFLAGLRQRFEALAAEGTFPEWE